MEPSTCDIAVIGGGLVGLASALAIHRRDPRRRLVVLEKEGGLARHQSGHNSGVIHSGVYYKPGSLKAKLSVEGGKRMRDFCAEQRIPFRTCGQLIVATGDSELPRLEAIHAASLQNGVAGVERVGPERIREIEPRAAGLGAVWAPGTAIVEYPKVAQAIARLLEAGGVEIRTFHRAMSLEEVQGGVRIRTGGGGELTAGYLVNCAGLYSDAVARMMGLRPDVRIIPLRGEYFALRPERCAGIRGLICPVPDPRFPLVGVHFTPTLSGGVVAGPNAVLAFAREGYSFWKVRWAELVSMLGYRGFWRMALRSWRTGLSEVARSLSRRRFVESMRRLVPDLTLADAFPAGSGVRAQAVDVRGDLIDDFRITPTPRALHVLNAPSPAATASLAIGEYVAERVPG